jgi:F-type H+-transporting ATPase subunit b
MAMASAGKSRYALYVLGAGALFALPCRAEESSGGLPQLDVTLFPAQLFWLAISFAVLYVLMSHVALPRVAKTQGNRKQIIAKEIDAARVASEAAKAAVAKVDKSLSEARAKAHASITEMMTEVANESMKAQAAKEKELLRRLHSVEAEIAVTRDEALKSVQASAADLAAVVVEKILGSRGRVGA